MDFVIVMKIRLDFSYVVTSVLGSFFQFSNKLNWLHIYGYDFMRLIEIIFIICP